MVILSIVVIVFLLNKAKASAHKDYSQESGQADHVFCFYAV